MSELVYTEEDMQTLTRSALEEGYEEGYEDGHNEGERFGREAAREQLEFDLYGSFGASRIDCANLDYVRSSPQEWLRDSVVDNLVELSQNDLALLAKELVNELESRNSSDLIPF